MRLIDRLALPLLVLAVVIPRFTTAELARPDLAAAIQRLQPRVDDARAEYLGDVIRQASDEQGIDPLLIVALIMRESSYREDVEQLRVLGARGERGLMQLAPRGAWREVAPEGCEDLVGAECQIRTGVTWLVHVRETCPGSSWRWVAAYGSSRCPSESEAERSPSIVRLRSLLAQLEVEP